MIITKDEARILAEALIIAKYEFSYPNNENIFDKFIHLENKLLDHAKDKRRTGRSSQDDWNDMLKRYKNK